MSLLDIKDVDISYGKNLTVKKVSMSLEKGEICSIVGESGSGKTTVIRAAMGLLPGGGRVSAGSITYDGMDLLGLTHEQWRALRGHDISMIFQDSGAMMNQTRLIGSTYVDKTFNETTLWNILLGGIPGFAIDAATGSITKPEMDSYIIYLDHTYPDVTVPYRPQDPLL